ncbi:hypothetical protein [Acidiphilium sp. PM]|uniref:hypothetical protein n=1 Tax=Acidiphilium sp. PM TaxID=1043206 RepID=UPI0009FFA9B5|nr:hypothetical protein [Acidiphilium sp. PM]
MKNFSPLPITPSPFRRVEGGPPTNADFMDRFGYDGSCPPASMTFPGGFAASEWTDYESRNLAERAGIEKTVPFQHDYERAPKVWILKNRLLTDPIEIADFSPDHHLGKSIWGGIGTIDAQVLDDPALWPAAWDYWASAVIGKPGQYLAALRRAIERRLGGDPRVILVCDTNHASAWAERFHERGILCETWDE